MPAREVKVTVLVQDEDSGTPAAFTVTQYWDRLYSLHDVLRAIVGKIRQTTPRKRRPMHPIPMARRVSVREHMRRRT